MNRRTSIASGLMLSLSLIGGASLMAQPMGGGPGAAEGRARPRAMAGDAQQRPAHEPGERLMKLLEEAGLTADQKAQVEQVFEKAKAERQAFRQAHEQEFKQLHEEMKAARESGDKQAIQAVREKQQQLMKQAASPKEVIQQVLAILTTEQKSKLLETILLRHGEPRPHERPDGAPDRAGHQPPPMD